MLRSLRIPYKAIFIVSIVFLLINSTMTEKKRTYSWTLKGSEILIEMETRSGKMPHGIYAIDPFNPKKPRLLIPGGERPVWSPKKTFFAYMKDEYLYIVRRDGKEETRAGFCVPDNGLHFFDPPVRWMNEDTFVTVDRNREFGSVVCISSAILPLKRYVDPRKNKIKWEDILTTNNPTFSPDGKFMAAEVYPAAPMDLQRSKSRIMIFRFPERGETPVIGWYGGVHVFIGPGNRLTSLSGEISELMPLWSPTGEWIAFTLCNLDKGYVAPVAIRPDGREMTFLLPPKPFTLWPSKEWFPIGVEPLQKAWIDGPPMGPALGMWGFPHIFAVEWSPDGKYLLLNQDEKFSFLAVAKWQDGRWWGRGGGGSMGNVRFAVWGEGPWFAYVLGFRPTPNDIIYVCNIETLEVIMLIPGSDAVIRWMDW